MINILTFSLFFFSPKQNNTHHYNLSFSNVRDIYSPVTVAGYFSLCETNLSPSISNNEFTGPGYLPLCRNDSIIYAHGLGVYIRDNHQILFFIFTIFQLSLFALSPPLFSALQYIKLNH